MKFNYSSHLHSRIDFILFPVNNLYVSLCFMSILSFCFCVKIYNKLEWQLAKVFPLPLLKNEYRNEKFYA